MPLSEVESQIVKTVVDRFFRLKESTARKTLVTRFRSPDALYRLTTSAILRTIDGTNQKFLPSTLAFHYSGDPDIIQIARRSVELVLWVLQNMFDIETEKVDFTPADVEAHARKLYDVVDPEEIRLGLYLLPDFGVLAGWSGNTDRTEVVTLRIDENIVTVKDIGQAWDTYIQQHTQFSSTTPVEYREMVMAIPQEPSTETSPSTHSGLSIFISHSSKDADLALALIELLKASLALTADRIRCSSVDGYRLPIGVNTEGKLREEVNAAKIVIGLITPSGLASYYVMFELGARWGANLFVAPLLAGVEPRELHGPLGLLNALSASSESQLHQLLADVAQKLALPLQPAHSYIRNITAVRSLAESAAPIAIVAPATNQKLRISVTADGMPPSQVLRIVANRSIEVSRVDYMLTSEAALAGEDVSFQGEKIEVPINDSSVLKLWNTPRADRNPYDHSGPAKIGLTVSADGDTNQYILPVQMEQMFQNNTAFRKIVGSRTFHR